VFSHFFIDPLLSKDMVEKEANAVNSEYEIDVSGDGWKLMHLMTLLANPAHPLSRFTIGNLDSLVKDDSKTLL
jgi:insulysin